MRVPRNTHLSFIRSIRADFPRHVPAPVEPVVEPAPVPVKAQVQAKSFRSAPVIKRELPPVVEAPVAETPEPVAVVVPEPLPVAVEQPVPPAPPVKKTRKRKTSA